jgi:hypothetical protein
MKQTKQFGISSDNYYANIIFQHIFVDYLKATKARDHEELFWIITQYFQTTQHFYQKNSPDIMKKITEAGKLIKPNKPTNQKELATFKTNNTLATGLLHECWREISNHLQRNEFFKRVYTNNESGLAVSLGQQ